MIKNNEARLQKRKNKIKRKNGYVTHPECAGLQNLRMLLNLQMCKVG